MSFTTIQEWKEKFIQSIVNDPQKALIFSDALEAEMSSFLVKGLPQCPICGFRDIEYGVIWDCGECILKFVLQS